MAVGTRHLPHAVKGAADLEVWGKLHSAGSGCRQERVCFHR